MIYFMQDSKTHAIKIGYSAGGGEARRGALQTGNAHPLVLLAEVPGDQAAERDLHDRFHEDRLCGEWFRPSPGLVSYIVRASSPGATGDTEREAGLFEGSPRPVWPIKFYFAGKMGVRELGEWSAEWRSTILGVVPRVRCPDDDGPLYLSPANLRPHTYVGPYHVADEWADKHVSSDVDEGDHGNDELGLRANDGHRGYAGERVLGRSLRGIVSCDVLFAWIDCLSCYGTLSEIGFARALGRDVWIASPHRMRDLWFVYEMAHHTAFGPLQSCFEHLLGCQRRLREHVARDSGGRP